MDLTDADPKGLIRESYRIEGITSAECRSIFIDWALSLADGQDARAAMTTLLKTYAADASNNHPMSQVLTEGLQTTPAARRRGGRAARQSCPPQS